MNTALAHQVFPQEKIAMCVCTRNRPQMLARCLVSLNNQIRPPATEVVIIVIDNNDVPMEALPEIGAAWRFAVHHAYQPVRGLSWARNAALEHAMRHDADWIAFIDDDEEAACTWLRELYSAATRLHADAVMGRVNYSFPPEAPKWRRLAPWADWANSDGVELDSAGSQNVMFRTDIAYSNDLRFDECANLRGGEDILFFNLYKKFGGKIVFSPKPVVLETVPWDRITIPAFMHKAWRNGIHKVYYKGLKRRKILKKGLWGAIKGMMEIICSMPIFAFNENNGMRMLVRGLCNISCGAALIYGLFGGDCQYYRKTTGY